MRAPVQYQYSGPNCSTAVWQQDSAPAPTLQAQGEEGGAGTAVGVIVTILILSLTITVTVYYRKRFHSLKTQMSHVHYSSSSHNNQPGQCQPHHFDNPVYATCRARATTITTPGSLNNGRVHNTIVKDTNKCRDKFNTLPPGSLRHMARCMEEEELSDDTNSEKGLSVSLERAASHCYHSAGFGCTGNAFSYSHLQSRRSCADLQGYNPNILQDMKDIKDNRRLQNVYGDLEKSVNKKELLKSPG